MVIAIPGAFTPVCSARHLPGFMEKVDELKAKGVDKVIFLAINDHWVMAAWGKAYGIYDDFIVSLSFSP